MRCPQCGRDGVQYVIDAYVIYDVSEDGSATVGQPYVSTFDDRFLECRDCGWKDERVDLQIGDNTLAGALE